MRTAAVKQVHYPNSGWHFLTLGNIYVNWSVYPFGVRTTASQVVNFVWHWLHTFVRRTVTQTIFPSKNSYIQPSLIFALFYIEPSIFMAPTDVYDYHVELKLPDKEFIEWLISINLLKGNLLCQICDRTLTLGRDNLNKNTRYVWWVLEFHQLDLW